MLWYSAGNEKRLKSLELIFDTSFIIKTLGLQAVFRSNLTAVSLAFDSATIPEAF